MSEKQFDEPKFVKKHLVFCVCVTVTVLVLIFTTHKWYVYLFGIPALVSAIVNTLFMLFRKKFDITELKEHHEVAGFIITTLGALYGVIVAFTIVNAQEHTTSLRRGVHQEAYMAANLFKTSEAIPVLRDEIHKKLYLYLKSVADNEWKFMSEKKEDTQTLGRLKDIWYAFYSYQPKSEVERIWFTQSLETLEEMNQARLVRVYDSWEYLDSLSWLALIVGGVIMIGFLFFFGTKNTRFQLAINAAFVFLITFLFMVTYLFNHPFAPPVKISPKSYRIIYDYYKTHGIYEEPDNLLPS